MKDRIMLTDGVFKCEYCGKYRRLVTDGFVKKDLQLDGYVNKCLKCYKEMLKVKKENRKNKGSFFREAESGKGQFNYIGVDEYDEMVICKYCGKEHFICDECEHSIIEKIKYLFRQFKKNKRCNENE